MAAEDRPYIPVYCARRSSSRIMLMASIMLMESILVWHRYARGNSARGNSGGGADFRDGDTNKAARPLQHQPPRPKPKWLLARHRSVQRGLYQSNEAAPGRPAEGRRMVGLGHGRGTRGGALPSKHEI